MSEEVTTPDLVELNRRAIDSAARSDFHQAMSVYGPDAVWDVSSTSLGTYQRVAVIPSMIEDSMGAFEDFEVKIKEVLDLSNCVVFTVVRQSGRPGGSSGHVELRYASVTEWTGSMIARVTHSTDIDEAHAAAEQLAESRG
jgi:ketosteroid isomerase-like protein